MHCLLRAPSSDCTLRHSVWTFRLRTAHLSLYQLRSLVMLRKDYSKASSHYFASTRTIFLQELCLHFVGEHQCTLWSGIGCPSELLRQKSLAEKSSRRQLRNCRIQTPASQRSTSSGSWHGQHLSGCSVDAPIGSLSSSWTHSTEMLQFVQKVLVSFKLCPQRKLDLIEPIFAMLFSRIKLFLQLPLRTVKFSK